MSHGFIRRKSPKVQQTRAGPSVKMNCFRSFSLAVAAFGMLNLSHTAGAQPLGINPSAAPSDLGNPSSINPAARASDVWNPSAINPAAAASQNSTAERDPWSTTPGARPAPAADHTAVACPHPRHDTAERDHGEAAGGATKARDRAGLEQASKRRHLAGAPGSLGDVLDRPGRYRRILCRAAVHDQRGRRASRPAHDYGNERCPEGYVL